MCNRFLLKATGSFLVSSVSFSSVSTTFSLDGTSVKDYIFKNKFFPLYLLGATIGSSALLVFLLNRFDKSDYNTKTKNIDLDISTLPKGDSQKDAEGVPTAGEIKDIIDVSEEEIRNSSEKDKEENVVESPEPKTEPEKIINGSSEGNDGISIWEIFKKLIFNWYTCAILFGFVGPSYLGVGCIKVYLKVLDFICISLVGDFPFLNIIIKIFPSYTGLIALLYSALTIFFSLKFVDIVNFCSLFLRFCVLALGKKGNKKQEKS